MRKSQKENSGEIDSSFVKESLSPLGMEVVAALGDGEREMIGGHLSMARVTSLVVQRFKLQVSNAGDPGSIPGQGTRSHMPQLKILHAATKIEDAMQLN